MSFKITKKMLCATLLTAFTAMYFQSITLESAADQSILNHFSVKSLVFVMDGKS
jgi:hypothetical protein